MLIDSAALGVSPGILANLGAIVTAIGALGTAAFGLVEAAKAMIGSINNVGFKRIAQRIVSLTPPETAQVSQAVPPTAADATPAAQTVTLAVPPVNALPQANVLATLRSNWFNGTDLVSQKAIAKSLIKLHLSPGNSADLAAATNVDASLLGSVATKMITGEAMSQFESDVYQRFDLIVTAMLDDVYQLADQDYRNVTRFLAAVVAVALSVAGGSVLNHGPLSGPAVSVWQALMVGLLATPLAPIAKDISTALSSAVNALQLIKRS